MVKAKSQIDTLMLGGGGILNWSLFELEHLEAKDGGCVWLRYKVKHRR